MFFAQTPTTSYVPLQTVQGLDLAAFCSQVGERQLIVWGAGHQGKVLQRAFDRLGHRNTAFCDSNTALHSQSINGKAVLAPQTAIELAKAKQAVLLIANAAHLNAIKQHCLAAGLQEQQDFYSYLRLARPEVVIQVADQRSGHCMAFSDYQAVLDKILSEIRGLLHIELSGWSDPLFNPYLPAIIEYTEAHLACTVTTPLRGNLSIEAVLKAQPSQLVVTLNGFGASFAANSPELSWDSVSERLQLLAQLSCQSTTTEFRVLLQCFNNVSADEVADLQALCDRLSLKLVIADSYPSDYQAFIDYCRVGYTDAHYGLQRINWDLPVALRHAEQDRYLPCLCQRIFPVIDAQQRVAVCHLYQDALLSDDYLSVDYSGLLVQRRDNPHCRLCQSHALHRLDVDVLQKRHKLNLVAMA